MDANVSIALFTKIKSVYASSDLNKFLSFPFFSFKLSAENFDIFLPEKIDLNGAGGEIKQVIERQKEFFNIFDDLVEINDTFKPMGSLSSIYLDVLANASFSDINTNKNVLDDIKKLNKKLMNSKGYTKKYSTYLECQRLFYEAQNNFRNDPSNPSNKMEFEKTNIDWIVKGNKNEIEDVISQLLALNNSINSSFYQSELLKMFQKNSYPIMENSLSMPDYLTTYYSPRNILSPEIKWQTINLFSENEINELYAKAPMGIKNLIGSIDSSNTIISLSIDIAYVDIVRDWLDPKLFEKNMWSFADNSKIISDGKIGYIKALLLAKNLKISYKTKENSTVVKSDNLLISDFIKFNKVSQLKQLNRTLIEPTNIIDHRVNQPKTTFMATSSATFHNPAFIMKDVNRRFMRNEVFLNKPILLQNQPIKVQTGTAQIVETRPIDTPAPKDIEVIDFENIDIIALVCEKIPACPL